jgi:uncharacterized protein (DUF2141 family)
MKRAGLGLISAVLLAGAPLAAAPVPVGPDAASCRADADGPAILVVVHGFRRQSGTIRVQLHGDNGKTWLKTKAWMRRIELPVSAPVMPVCIKVPQPGRYAIAIRHDMDGDRKMTKSDGGGYSNNPSLGITKLQARYNEASFTVGNGVKQVDVVMNYLQGLSVRPIRKS